MAVAERAYHLTVPFPKEETYGMTSQTRRAAASIAANIAEGYGREHSGSFIQFLRISQGSLKELEAHLLLSARVSLLPTADIEPLLQQCDELGKIAAVVNPINSTKTVY
jgi:four helix bundle protein